jgi:hypothetical protein
MDEFRSVEDYELFVYSVRERYSAVTGSTLRLERRGSTYARVSGDIDFRNGYRITVRELVSFDTLPLRIEDYGYEIWCHDTKRGWYDSQPHPNSPNLQATHPHHKHVPPDLKRNRVPAPGFTFMAPNIPILIAEVAAMAHADDA